MCKNIEKHKKKNIEKHKKKNTVIYFTKQPNWSINNPKYIAYQKVKHIMLPQR